MIISLFGPDGIGKTTIAHQFRDAGYTVLSGTDVASWPDKGWHTELTKKGLDETRINHEDHFKEKIKRAHNLARHLSKTNNVLIDSDPLHKTLMHDYLRLHRKNNALKTMSSRFSELSKVADLDTDNHIHIYLKLTDDIPKEEQASILQKRINDRGERAPFDPETINESIEMIEACELLKEILEMNGHRIITINTNDTVPIKELIKKVSF